MMDARVEGVIAQCNQQLQVQQERIKFLVEQVRQNGGMDAPAAPGTADSQELPSESNSDGPMRAMQKEIKELIEALQQMRNQSPPPPPTGSFPRTPAQNVQAIQDVADHSYQTELQLAQERGDTSKHQG